MSVSIPLSGSAVLKTDLDALVMGIVNATDDSFWQGSRFPSTSQGVDLALRMVEEGADILDIGAESTRPGAPYVSAEQEIERLIPLIQGIRSSSSVPISIDTRKAKVFSAALEAGVDMLNDVSALEDDEELAPLAARSGVPVVLMHKKGNPATMQDSPSYTDVVKEVSQYLLGRARRAIEAGIHKDRIIFDPGIGFGKRLEDNRALISGLAEIVQCGYPVLMALSRKSCIGAFTGRDVADRLAGTVVANVLSVQQGAKLLRVHDVRETIDMLKVYREISGSGIH